MIVDNRKHLEVLEMSTFQKMRSIFDEKKLSSDLLSTTNKPPFPLQYPMRYTAAPTMKVVHFSVMVTSIRDLMTVLYVMLCTK